GGLEESLGDLSQLLCRLSGFLKEVHRQGVITRAREVKQQINEALNASEWRAQLVRGSGDEVVLHAVELALLAIGALKLHVRAGVLDGLGGLGSEELQEPEVVVGEGTALSVVEDVQDANDLPTLDEWDGDYRTEILILVDGGARRVCVVVVHI